LRIVIKRNDGGVSVMHPTLFLQEVIDAAPNHLEEIIGAELAQWPPEDQAAVVSWRAVPDEAIPTDRTFRNAWVDDGKAVQHDMPKARNIWRNKMRKARAPLLAGLDVEVMRALEQGKPTTDIATRKQALRDVTADPAIEAAQTPEALKAVWPQALATGAAPAAPAPAPLGTPGS
jgi:hypothetical protein